MITIDQDGVVATGETIKQARRAWLKEKKRVDFARERGQLETLAEIGRVVCYPDRVKWFTPPEREGSFEFWVRDENEKRTKTQFWGLFPVNEYRTVNGQTRAVKLESNEASYGELRGWYFLTAVDGVVSSERAPDFVQELMNRRFDLAEKARTA